MTDRTGVVAVVKPHPRVDSVTIGAVVTRADGRIEDLGVVAEWRRAWWAKWLQKLGLEDGFAVLQVNAGRAVVTNLIVAVATQPKWGAWGTGAGTTAAADTTLFTEDTTGGYARISATFTQQTTTTTNDTAQAVYTITAKAALGITNAGLFDALTVGNLWLKGDFSVINVAINDTITFTFKVAYT